MKKDFIIIIKYNLQENYWEMIILKYALALFNQSFFNNFIKEEDHSKFYENKQFSVVSIRSSLNITKIPSQELNKGNLEQVKELNFNLT